MNMWRSLFQKTDLDRRKINDVKRGYTKDK